MTLTDNDTMTAIRVDDFWSAVDRSESDECWRWTGSISPKGYGRFSLGHRTLIASHRIAWMLATRESIPEGFDVCHTCDIRNCVRNDDIGTYEINGVLRPRRGHLWLGTNVDNVNDKMAKGRAPYGDLNGSRLHPERVPSGDRHGFRLHPECVPRGSHNGSAKLTEKLVVDIRDLYRSHQFPSYQSLAGEFGVSKSLIGQIIRRDIWRSVA